MKINRLLKLIMILMNRQDVTVKYLAEHFEVSRKTIYRDLETLITSGIPVCYGEDAKGIVYIMEGFSLKYAVLPTKENASEIVDISNLVDTDEPISSSEIELRKEAWHTFMAQKQFDLEEIKKEILQSWKRCQRETQSLYHIEKEHIHTPEEARCLSIENMPEYEIEGFKLFDYVIKSLGLHIVIVDKNSRLKYIFNLDEDFNKLYPKLGYFKDSSEKAIGTSATCLALIENKPSKVIGPEHYSQLFHQFSGASAPFYENGELAGCLSLFFLHTSVTNHTLNMVFGLARLYESLIIKGSQTIPNSSEEIEELEASYKESFNNLIGDSIEWKTVISVAKSFADNDVTLLLRGEEGVGKRSIAKCIHSDGKRSGGPCIDFDCLSVPEDLLKMTLLGYPDGNKKSGRRGLIERAVGGTLILSNVEHLSEELQKRLFTLIKSKKMKRLSSNKLEAYDVRIIVCTTLESFDDLHKPLKALLEIAQLKIPPLRNRRADIRKIVRYYINEINGPITLESKVSATIIKHLEKEEWLGNVRELLNKVKKIIVLESEQEKYFK